MGMPWYWGEYDSQHSPIEPLSECTNIFDAETNCHGHDCWRRSQAAFGGLCFALGIGLSLYIIASSTGCFRTQEPIRDAHRV